MESCTLLNSAEALGWTGTGSFFLTGEGMGISEASSQKMYKYN